MLPEEFLIYSGSVEEFLKPLSVEIVMVDKTDPEYLRRRLESTRRRQCKKLTPAQVDEMKQIYATTTMTQRELAVKYGVSESSINHALRTTWTLDPDGTPRTGMALRATRKKFKHIPDDILWKVRTDYASGMLTQHQIAVSYGISIFTVNKILKSCPVISPSQSMRLRKGQVSTQDRERLEQLSMGRRMRAMTLGDMPRED